MLGVYRDNGKSNGNYYIMLGVYKDNGKANGNYYKGYQPVCCCFHLGKWHLEINGVYKLGLLWIAIAMV